jgi:hypothetical protein
MNAKVNISNRAGASFPVRRMDFESRVLFTKNCSPSGKRADNAVIKCVNAAS